MKIRRVGFAWVEHEDHALALDVDFHLLHSGNLFQHRAQSAHAFIAIFPFCADFDRFQSRRHAPKKIDRPDRDQQVVRNPWSFIISFTTRGSVIAVAFRPLSC